MAEKFIQEALSKKGSKGKLHRELGVPENENIPAKKLMKAEHSNNPKIRKQAQFAETLKGLNRHHGMGRG